MDAWQRGASVIGIRDVAVVWDTFGLEDFRILRIFDVFDLLTLEIWDNFRLHVKNVHLFMGLFS
jgi:hypothetical protein